VRQLKQLQAKQTDGRWVPGKLYSQGWKTLPATKKNVSRKSFQENSAADDREARKVTSEGVTPILQCSGTDYEDL